MNTKRQTIWIVSMLSLMVVLSAYYLFTDDPNKKDDVATGEETGYVDMDITEVIDDHENSTDAANAGEDTTAEETAGSSESEDSTDDEVLEQVQAQGKTGSDYFVMMQMKRDEMLDEEAAKLMEVIADTNQDIVAVEAAYDELDRLTDVEEKLINLEDLLMVDYPNAVVSQEDEKYRVIVQSNELQRSQAVSIVDLVMSEMNVGPDKVIVEYMQ